uniref:Reverse transcriptase Ty1/copia-type domain-containing protein n=1 Tax=Tanacetum cinerariifolium TaxID=118510 RepID=A0A6L2M915_TANCI|nr:hypothetical protein [Tanacetum cinerariifolium]
MTDYSLCEVILNGDSPLPTRSIDDVEKPYPPTTIEEKLARKNELKARGTLLMALSNEHQLKFNSYKTTKSLMKVIEKRFGVNTTHGVSASNSKTNASNLPNVDSLKDTDDTKIFSDACDDEVERAEAHFNNLELTIVVSPIPTTRIHKDHPKEQIIGEPLSALQTKRMTKTSQEHDMKVWRLVNLPKGKHAIRTKWVYRNKKDTRGIVVRNKARLVVQGYTQKEGIDYDEVFAHVAKIEAIRLFMAYASFIGFIVCQMEVKSSFLYGTIEEEVYVCQPPGFEYSHFPNKVYKEKGDILLVHMYVDEIVFGSTKKSLYTEFKGLMHKKFQMSSIGELTILLGLQVMQKDDGTFMSQDKYVADILKKFDFSSIKIASTLIETNKELLKDKEAEDVDVHLYRLMLGSLVYLTASRPDIIYLKGQPKLGLWYLRDSPFDLEAFSDSDYAGASLDRKSTIGGCQFLGLWYLRDSPFDLEAFSDSDYAGASLDRKSTIGGCQFLEKPTESEGFEQIVDFLNANPIKYALTVNPTIYTLCIQQFWDSAKEEVGEGSEEPTDTYHTPIVTQPSSFQPQKKQKSRRKQRKEPEGRIAKIDADKDLSFIDETAQAQGRMNEKDSFGINGLDGVEVIVDVTAGENVEYDTTVAEKEVSIAAGEVVTIAEAKPRARGAIVQERSEFRTTSSSQPSQLPQAKDKGKGIMIEPEKPLKKKEQIIMDEEVARKLEAQMKPEIEEEERIAREKDEANIALIKE